LGLLQKSSLVFLFAVALNGCTWVKNGVDKGLGHGSARDSLTRKVDERRGKRYKQKGVNAYLWRASMDMVGHWPLLRADPRKGVIETDWQSAPASPDERTKFVIEVLSPKLRRDTLRVSVARETRQAADSDWMRAPSPAATAQTMEELIVLKAQALR
jgi:hypothetical protein